MSRYVGNLGVYPVYVVDGDFESQLNAWVEHGVYPKLGRPSVRS